MNGFCQGILSQGDSNSEAHWGKISSFWTKELNLRPRWAPNIPFGLAQEKEKTTPPEMSSLKGSYIEGPDPASVTIEK